jgi:hypothetical protein
MEQIETKHPLLSLLDPLRSRTEIGSISCGSCDPLKYHMKAISGSVMDSEQPSSLEHMMKAYTAGFSDGLQGSKPRVDGEKCYDNALEAAWYCAGWETGKANVSC